jgi:hypothetical protein
MRHSGAGSGGWQVSRVDSDPRGVEQAIARGENVRPARLETRAQGGQEGEKPFGEIFHRRSATTALNGPPSVAEVESNIPNLLIVRDSGWSY